MQGLQVDIQHVGYTLHTADYYHPETTRWNQNRTQSNLES